METRINIGETGSLVIEKDALGISGMAISDGEDTVAFDAQDSQAFLSALGSILKTDAQYARFVLASPRAATELTDAERAMLEAAASRS